MLKKSLALLAAFCMTASLAACSGGDPGGDVSGEGIDCSAENPYVIQLAHTEAVNGDSVVNVGAQFLKDAIEEKSGGAFQIEIFGNSSLGTEVEVFDGMGMGTVQMAGACNSTFSNLIPELQVLDLPYMFSSQAIVDEVVRSGAIKELYDRVYNDYGVKVLATGKSGFKNIITTYGFVHDRSDLKGKKFRALPSPICIENFEYMGGSGTGMALTEVITALQQGTIDGLDNPIATVYSTGLYTVAPYYSITEHAFTPYSFCMAKSEWDKMSEEQQGWWLEAADEAVTKQVAAADEIEQRLLKKMEDEGLKVSDDVDKEAFREAVQPMYEKYRDQIGGELLDEIVQMTKDLEAKGL